MRCPLSSLCMRKKFCRINRLKCSDGLFWNERAGQSFAQTPFTLKFESHISFSSLQPSDRPPGTHSNTSLQSHEPYACRRNDCANISYTRNNNKKKNIPLSLFRSLTGRVPGIHKSGRRQQATRINRPDSIKSY